MKRIKKNKKWKKKKQRKRNKESKLKKEVAIHYIQVQVLEKSGVLDAYEYFLRSVCKNGLPEANIF